MYVLFHQRLRSLAYQLTEIQIMAKNKGTRIWITLEHKCMQGAYRYHTTKNRRNTTERLELRKYSPVTRKHELFREIK